MASVTPNNEVLATPNIVEIGLTLDEARRKTRYIASAGNIYPSTVDFDDAGLLDAPGFYVAAPWFYKTSVLDCTIISGSESFLLVPSRSVEIFILYQSLVIVIFCTNISVSYL